MAVALQVCALTAIKCNLHYYASQVCTCVHICACMGPLVLMCVCVCVTFSANLTQQIVLFCFVFWNKRTLGMHLIYLERVAACTDILAVLSQ